MTVAQVPEHKWHKCLLTALVFVQTVLIEKLLGCISGLLKEFRHCDLAEGKGLPVAGIFRVLVKVIILRCGMFNYINSHFPIHCF